METSRRHGTDFLHSSKHDPHGDRFCSVVAIHCHPIWLVFKRSTRSVLGTCRVCLLRSCAGARLTATASRRSDGRSSNATTLVVYNSRCNGDRSLYDICYAPRLDLPNRGRAGPRPASRDRRATQHRAAHLAGSLGPGFRSRVNRRQRVVLGHPRCSSRALYRKPNWMCGYQLR